MAFHGIQIRRQETGVRPVTTVLQSLIGFAGTAPNAKRDGAFGTADGTAIEYNKPFYIASRQDASDEDLGTDGTLYPALNAIFRQGQAPVQMVIVPEGVRVAPVAEQALAVKEFSDETTQAGVTALTGVDVRWALIDVAGIAYLAFKNITTPDENILDGLAVGRHIEVYASGGSAVLKTYTVEGSYDTTNDRIQVNADAETTTLTNGTDYDLKVAGVPEVLAEDATRQNLTGSQAELTGVYALLAADPIPKILCVGSELANTRPGGNANPVASALVEVATRLRGTAVLDGPNTTNADVLAFADDFDLPNAYLVDPGVITADGAVLASPSVAGLIAVNDLRNGFWTSPSNMGLQGVIGTQRDISSGFVGSHADVLNSAYIATIIKDGGFRLWGNETLSTVDPSYRFLNIARTANVIEDSLRAAHRWAIDRNITVRYFEIVAQSVNSFLKKLTAQGSITGGECYPDGEKNTPAKIKEGQVFFNVEWSGSYPAQTLNIALQLSDRFLNALLAAL